MKNRTPAEQRRVEELSSWYLTDQLPFDRDLIRFRHATIQPHFRGTRALELGPADGEMTRLLLGEFAELTVVDASRDLLDTLPHVDNLEKVNSLFADFRPARRYSTVIMEHILEHVDDPVALLKQARDWIEPNGVLIAGVPNGNSIHRLVAVKMGLLNDKCELNDRDRALGHRRVYLSETFHADVERAGYTIIASGGVFFKPLSNKQIQDTFSAEMIRGFYELGRDFPAYTAELFVVCEL